jgi:hypothetical protein
MLIRSVVEVQCYASNSCGFATNMWAHVPYSVTSTQYQLVCCDCQIRLANTQCGICYEAMPRILRCTWTSIIWVEKLPLWHKLASRVLSWAISTWIPPKLSYCKMWLADMQWSIVHNESHDICWRDCSEPEGGRNVHFLSKYVRRFMLQASGAFQICK